MGKSERNKGSRAENELASILSDQLGVPIKRILGQAREGGGDLRVGKYLLEVKRQETLAIPQWLRQAEAAAKRDGGTPLVVFRKSREPWRAVIPLEDLLQLLRGGIDDAR